MSHLSLPSLEEAARSAGSWPFKEARKLLARFEKLGKFPDVVVFETGYGPSGLPHIGTFGEIVRTSMVKKAFETLVPGCRTQLVCFSDDMDALRKVPENVPHPECLEKNMGKPLTQVPDPFGQCASFGEYNNNKLKAFLDAHVRIPYTFMSATACYKSGLFDVALRAVLRSYDEILGVMLPSLGQERRITYSPILPICPRTGRVLLVAPKSISAEDARVTYADPETGEDVTISVLGGRCKLQWKVDWAMRWIVLGVHYEMSGKDLIDSFSLASRICRIVGHNPPEGCHYELFLDEDGKKISKSKGNGLSVEEWIRYAPPGSLKYFMYQSPRVAKKLHFGAIPRTVDDYVAHLRRFGSQDLPDRLNNPVWHLDDEHRAGKVSCSPVSFSLLLELVKASAAKSADVLWGFIARYVPDVKPGASPLLDAMVASAIEYFHNFVEVTLVYRQPTQPERQALEDLAQRIEGCDQGDAEFLQGLAYQVGREHGFKDPKAWFKVLYEVILGRPNGPRFGSFVALYGGDRSAQLIRARIAPPQ